MATTVEPRSPRLLMRWKEQDPPNPEEVDMEVVMGFGEERVKWELKKGLEGERGL